MVNFQIVIVIILISLAFSAEDPLTEGVEITEEAPPDPHATIEGAIHPNDENGKRAEGWEVEMPPKVGNGRVEEIKD